MSMSSDNAQVIRSLQLSDLDYLNEHLLEVNKTEIMAMRGQTVKELFEQNPDMLEASQVLDIEGDLVCVGGGKMTEQGFVIWLFGTDKIEQFKKQFAIVTSRRVALWKEQHDLVYSYVYSKNELTKKWLVSLGFTIFEPEAVGVNGEEFHYFEWRKPCA